MYYFIYGGTAPSLHCALVGLGGGVVEGAGRQLRGRRTGAEPDLGYGYGHGLGSKVKRQWARRGKGCTSLVVAAGVPVWPQGRCGRCIWSMGCRVCC